MARKKPNRTRVQQFKAQRRNSWIRFLTKITLFFVPVIALTAGLIFFLLPQGEELPILVLNLETQPERKQANAWKRINYGISDTELGIRVPEIKKFGGPRKDVLFVFNDLLGSARRLQDNGPEQACVFVPKTEPEHQTHAFRGLLSPESTEEQSQWQAFDEYVKTLVGEIEAQRVEARDDRYARVVLVFDIDHPDLPGRIPPQANSFIKLCRQKWEQPETGTRAELAKSAPNLEVHVWLSHSEGQKSYYDSDFEKVESFFKRRFERGITGDVIQVAEDPKDVFYSNLKQYVKDWVETDADIHKLSQSPTFLEPKQFDDFPILRKKFLESQKNGKLFNYVARTNEPSYELDNLWKELDEIKIANHWNQENPLLIQRSTMLLLQMEKLWYVGQGDSELFEQLKRRLESELKTTTTIAPVKHTLHDALAEMPNKSIEPLNLNWLAEEPAAAAASTTDDSESEKQLEAAREQRNKNIVDWKTAHPDWSRSLGVWQAICQIDKIGVSKSTLIAAMSLLDEQQRSIARPETSTQVNDLTKVYWNEIGYLERLTNELAWPAQDNSNFEELVLLSIKSRDRFNQLAAQLTPALVDKFENQINDLENRRRQNEDRLFANDHANLRTDFKQLDTELLELQDKHRRLKESFLSLQKQLLIAPHDFRYCLESMTVPNRGNDKADVGQKQLPDLKRWEADEQGFVINWQNLGKHRIGKMIERQDERDEIEKLEELTSKFEASRTSWHLSTGSTDFATNPYDDFKKYSDNPDSLGAADGNLLGRRLLCWPGLDQTSRANIRRDLSQEPVDRSGEIQSLNPEQQELADEFAAQFADRLAEFFAEESVQILTPLGTNEIPYTSGDENYFTQVAYDVHRLFSKPDDATSQNLVVAINDFRCKKSNFDLGRVADDLWATPLASSKDEFVVSSLTNHKNLVEARIRNMGDGSHATREKLTAIWEAGPKKDWPARIDQVKEFCAHFKNRNWFWDRKEQKAVNEEIAKDVQAEISRGQSLVFTLSTSEKPFDTVFQGTFDVSNRWIDPKTVSGNSLGIYLRGHSARFAAARAPVPPKPVSFEIAHENADVPGAQLIVKRANPGPVSGHLTILIDCSGSMATNGRMSNAKRDVNQFLESIKDRADIAISLVAIGAGEKFDGSSFTPRPKQELSLWEMQNKSDVWFFAEKGKLVDRVVDENSIDKFKDAVSQLKSFGDTPILAGLDAAINAMPAEKGRPQLVVLLTDGFEFGHRKERQPDELFAEFNDGLYKTIAQQLNKKGLELVVFSFLNQNPDETLPDAIAREFKPMIDQKVPLTEIENRIDRIRKLATINKQANETTLKKFFGALLPNPLVVVTDEGAARLIAEREVEDGFDLNRDKQLSDEEKRIMQAITLGADDHPNAWSVGIKFAQNARDNTAKAFAQAPSAWRSETRVAGNEKLEFEYNPLLSTFDLTTDTRLLVDTQEVEFGSQALLVGTASNITSKPGFQLASKARNQLTPAPAMAFLTMEQSSDKNNLVLLQDFNLNPQTRSNVHPLEFLAFKDELREASFPQKSVDMNLHLIPEFTPQFWTKIYFNLANQLAVENDQQRKQTIKEGVYVGINDLFPRSLPFNKYEIQLERKNEGDFFIYSIRISALEDSQAIDRWLVQVLDPGGEIDRSINENTRRTYIFKKDSNGTKTLQAIEHHFYIKKSKLKESQVAFGFAHLDHFDNVNVSKIKYPKHFGE